MPLKPADCRFVGFFTVFVAVMLLMACFAVSANNLRFERLTTEQGLSQMSVNDVFQDRHGFIWFATQDGLNRYDGYQFKVYKYHHQDPHSLSDNRINRLFEDRHGVLWIGTDGGLHQYDPTLDRFIHYRHEPNNPDSIGGNIVKSIAQDSDGNLWLALYQKGLSRFDPQSKIFTHYAYDSADPHSLSSDKVVYVLVDHQNTVWVATLGGGLNRFDRKNNRFDHFTHNADNPDSPGKLRSNLVSNLYQDKNNTLWLGTVRKGVSRFDPDNDRFIHNWADIDNAPQTQMISAIFQDRDDNYWFGTARNGLYRLDAQNNRFSHFRHDSANLHTLGSDHITSITQDHSGIIWFGTHNGGVSKHNPATARFKHLTYQPEPSKGLQDDDIWALYEDNVGDIWVGTQGSGVSRYQPDSGKFDHYSYQSGQSGGINDNTILSIYQDHENMMWFGSNARGLNQFDPTNQTFRYFTHQPDDPTSLSNDIRVVDIIEDHEHYLWVGTADGLNRLDPDRKQFTRFIHDPENPHSISSKIIQSLFEDNQGVMWIGTYDQGLEQYDKTTGQFIHYRHDPNNSNSISSNTVLSIYQSADGIMWLGTTVGLNRFDPQTKIFTHYRQLDGLSNETVMGVMGNGSDELWLTTNNGLNRFNIASETFNTFRFSDGLQNNEFSMGAYHKTRSGQMMIGGISGFNTFYPQQINHDTNTPKVVFSDFLLDNQSVHPKLDSVLSANINQVKQLVLDHTQSVFTFEFAALHFINPKQNQYRYQLTGFDNHWITTNALNRRATYTNMDSGDYVFKVQGSNSDNVWSAEPRQIKVTILAAPWQTRWAYTIYLLLTMGLISTFVYLRYKKLMAERETAAVVIASEQQLSLALWGSGDQLWDWDKSKGVIQRKNILRHFSFPLVQQQKELADPVLDIHPADRGYFNSALWAHCQGHNEYFECSYRIKDKNDLWRWVLDRGKVVETNHKGEATRLTGTLQDIHNMRIARDELRDLNETLEQKVIDRTQALQNSIDQLKAAQQQLVEAEKMASLGNLVAGVAHEVNTPLGICITMVSLLMEKLDFFSQQMAAGKMTRKLMNDYISETANSQALVDSNLHRAAELVQSFKKVAVNQSEDNLDDICFNEYLRDIIKTVLPSLEKDQISITLDCEEDLKIKTYPGAWWQIVSNLIENSRDHGFLHSTADNKQITLNAELTEQGMLRFVYCDNGCGMAQNALDKIYEPFYTTTRNHDHTGLGMHIVYNLVVHKFAGKIQCQSTLGQGVTYIVDTPFEKVANK